MPDIRPNVAIDMKFLNNDHYVSISITIRRPAGCDGEVKNKFDSDWSFFAN